MKLNLDSINNINLFENLTNAKVKDCFADNGKLVFLVEEGNVKKALGKNNFNINRLSKILKKDIRIIAFSNDVCKFIANLIYPNKPDSITLESKTVVITISDNVVKGRVFGRSKENLKRISAIVKNYFDIQDIKLI